jgi:hypothetical protein
MIKTSEYIYIYTHEPEYKHGSTWVVDVFSVALLIKKDSAVTVFRKNYFQECYRNIENIKIYSGIVINFSWF